MAEQGESHGDALERIAKVGTYRTPGRAEAEPGGGALREADGARSGCSWRPAVFLIFLPAAARHGRDAAEARRRCCCCVIVLWISEAMPIPIGGLLGIALHRGDRRRAGRRRDRAARAPRRSSSSSGRSSSPRRCCQPRASRAASRSACSSIPGVGKSTSRTVIVASAAITCAAVGVRVQHRDGRHAAAHRDRDPRHDREHHRGRDAAARASIRSKLRVGIALMLMLAYGASVGGLLTPVGSPPNLIGRGLIEEATGESISFAEWVGAGAPDLRRDVRRAVRDPAAAQQARDQADGGRRGVRGRRARRSWGRSRARRRTR